MKGRIFIGWNADSTLAEAVAKQLGTVGFGAIVGGNKTDDGNYAPAVSETILKQMQTCAGAIMLFSKRKESVNGETVFTHLSPNMLYELGYLTGSLKPRRVFSFYIDGARQYEPSDLNGTWDRELFSEGKTVEQQAEEIVDAFLDAQYDAINENKMRLVSDISRLRAILSAHIQCPTYYDSEIAEFIMLYCQSAYMFDDMDNAEAFLKDLLKHVQQNKNCLYAINSSFGYFKACASLVETDFCGLQLPKKVYEELNYSFSHYAKKVEKLDDKDPFKYIFLMTTYDYISFINMMHYGAEKQVNVPAQVLESREKAALQSIYYAQKYRELNPAKNNELSYLYESYTYRNLALFYRSVERFDEAQRCFEKSIETRRQLYDYFDLRQLNKNIFDQIKMEYYLSLKDNILDVDEDTRFERVMELRRYIDYTENVSWNRSYLVSEIKNVIKQIEED